MQAFIRPWTPPAGTLGELTAQAHERALALAPRQRDLERAAAESRARPSFAEALRGRHVAVIAELKRSSPSKGAINPGMSARDQAAAYAAGGAAALSVLTEPARFGGRDEDLAEARSATSVPLLKKDFHVHELQVLEARALGASALLLIARALSPEALEALAAEARAVGLETLIEIRDEAELDRAIRAGASAIGVNNRDLETLVIHPDTAERIIPLIPTGIPAIWESGVQDASDVERAAWSGADAVLVGSSVSAAADPAAAVRALAGTARQPRR